MAYIKNQTEDYTGRNRLASNVIYSWVGQLVIIIAGFVMPRLIDSHIGQFSLGIWDFTWSLVNYLSLTGLGVGASASRYIARYRAEGRLSRLRETTASVFYIQVVIALVCCMGTAGFVWSLPLFFSSRLGAEMDAAIWVVAMLGGSVAIQMLFDVYRGVLTGGHRWDLFNLINAASRFVTVGLMFAVLIMGGGLRSISIVYVAVVSVTAVLRMIVAYRICPEISIHWKYVDKVSIMEMLRFGIKTVVAHLPALLVIQTTSILVVSSLGPAMLAVFMRPLALVRHIETFINRFSFVLTPTVGSLQVTHDQAVIKQFMTDSARYGVAFTLPLIIILVVFGDHILQLWMGSRYANGMLIIIMATGYLLPVAQSTVMRVLMGMNLHGRVVLINLAVTVIVFIAMAALFYGDAMTILDAALLVVVPLTLGNGIVVPIYGCYKLQVSGLQYIKEVFLIPVACSAVFAICLVLSRLIFPSDVSRMLTVGLVVGGIILTVLYWCYLLEENNRARILQMVQSKLRKQTS